MASPAAPQPKHLYIPLFGATEKEGVFSLWKGQQAQRFCPFLFKETKSETTSSISTLSRICCIVSSLSFKDYLLWFPSKDKGLSGKKIKWSTLLFGYCHTLKFNYYSPVCTKYKELKEDKFLIKNRIDSLYYYICSSKYKNQLYEAIAPVISTVIPQLFRLCAK